MRLLELFSGTKSVSKAVGHLYDEIVSVDILNNNNPTFCCDILLWDYKQYPVGYFDAIWASPPCTEYSRLKNNTKMNTNLDVANLIVLRTIEIIDYLKPDKWFIENPQTGILKDQYFMLGIPFYDVDYCRFSDWGYKKRTRIWTNKEYDNKLCYGKDKCINMIGKYHKVSFGGQGRDKPHTYIKISAKENVYKIPEQLIKDLFDCI
jgi:site-specific DNA-cytosine methylase